MENLKVGNTKIEGIWNKIYESLKDKDLHLPRESRNDFINDFNNQITDFIDELIDNLTDEYGEEKEEN